MVIASFLGFILNMGSIINVGATHIRVAPIFLAIK